MEDFFEIDFLDVEAAKSGDAIAIRYRLNDETCVHVVDGGFQDTGEKLVEHIKQYYGNPSRIDRVVVTHPDGDHAGGLRTVLEEFEVGELWMLRPWVYAEELIDRFRRFSSVENLKKRLREVYPNIAALEEIATDQDIPIYEPFQGEKIGAFTVMAPTRSRYLDLVVDSERTPEASKEVSESSLAALTAALGKIATKVASFVKALWGEETFSPEETTAENQMSVVQFANLCSKRILLTGDAGRDALAEAADYAESIGIPLPGIDRFQVPHHGSRRNVSTEVLDRWLGERLKSRLPEGHERFSAFISASKADEDHPRKAVIRACIHRGARVVWTKGTDKRTSHNAPDRDGWSVAPALPYPEETEE